jgi:WD40 repeat protein
MNSEIHPVFSRFQKRLKIYLDITQTSMSLSSNGDLLITGGDSDRTIKVWNLQNGEIVRSWFAGVPSFSRDQNRIYTLAISPDTRTLVSGGSKIQHWELETGKEIRTFKGGGWALRAEISPDGLYLLTINEDKLVVWNLCTGKKQWSYVGEVASESLIISPNSQTVIGKDSYRSKINVWSLRTGQILHDLTNKNIENLRWLTTSSDGTLVAGSGLDSIEIWNYSDGQNVQSISKFINPRFHKHLDIVTYPMFSPNKRFLLSCGTDGLIQAWDIATGRNIDSFESENWINSMILSMDNSTLVTHSRNERIIEVWEIAW